MGPRLGVRGGAARAGAPRSRWSAASSPYDVRCRRSDGTIRVPGLTDKVEVLRDEPRHPAGVRRQQRRPVLRPGVRPGAGPVLRDGLPPPRHRRPDQRAARQADRRDRHVHPHDGLAPRRGPRVRPAHAGHPVLPRRLQRRRERLPRRQVGHAAVRGVHRARPRRPRLQAGEVDAGRLARLAQGDGVGPARQHGRGDRAHPALARAGARSRSTSSTRATPTTGTRRSCRPPTASARARRRDPRSARRR